MDFEKIDLPSNKVFGLFFTAVFSIVGCYFFILRYEFYSYLFFILSFIFILITYFKSELMLPLNRLWMIFGYLLGMLMSPIIFGLIFFGLITPLALVMRVLGRDALKLKFCKQSTYWTLVDKPEKTTTNFKKQY